MLVFFKIFINASTEGTYKTNIFAKVVDNEQSGCSRVVVDGVSP
jgi:hypothetical protein